VIHGCYIESGCLIGISATILDGARIGANSLVAAGSLVTPNTEVPPNSLVMGVPASVKRKLSEDEIENIQKFWQNYISLINEYQIEQSFYESSNL
jgi:carbonic anhydrase/acetyltransferase-like protein (isoleucine patch superfamily)